MENLSVYKYIGPPHLLSLVKPDHQGEAIHDRDALTAWFAKNQQGLGQGRLTATFVISEQQILLLAGRHSEHVACAGGRNVLAAGEVTFCLDSNAIVVCGITNQSTGYCPQVTSWDIVHRVLNAIPVPHPAFFTHAFEFRRCTACGNTNIIKEDDFTCAICDEKLDEIWNYA